MPQGLDASLQVVPAGARAVLLDGLGTLVRLRPPWEELMAILRERHGLEVEPGEAERAFRAEIAYYRAHHPEGRDELTLADLRARCAEVLARELPSRVGAALSRMQLTEAMLGALRFEAYPDVPDALLGLRARGCRLVVVSNWDVSLSVVLAELGLSELLDGVVTSAEVGVCKPERAIFERALARAGAEPAEALHVGDSFELDVRGARGAGIAAALIARSPADAPADDASRARAEGVPVIASLAQLLA